MKIILAGGTGFLGRHILEALREAGHSIVLLARGTRAAALEDGVSVVNCDASAGAIPLGDLGGCSAIVNLIGIKREEGAQTFERAHVDAVARLIEAARELGIRRLIHVSVVASRPDARSAYHDTKWRAEELVRGSGLDFTILRPGVVYGKGDDMISHLVKMIRVSPVFPVVGRGRSILQPVDVRDVARAVASALEGDASIGKSYDLVGARRMTLREVVGTVADGARRRVCIVGTPIWLQQLAVSAMNRLFRNPLSTPAQLRMLIDGLYGDPGPARKDLGVEFAAFTPEAVRATMAAPAQRPPGRIGCAKTPR